MQDWGRIITAMVTPMDKNGEVNYEKAAELAKRLEKQASSALIISGTTGESPTLESDERAKLLCAVKQSVSIPVILGVGTNSTKATINNIRVAEQNGADGVLAVVPYYNKPNQESLYAHFEAVANSTRLPVMLYNVPGRTGMNMTAETSVKLSHIDNIAALKEACGDLSQLAAVVRDAAPGFRVYTGEDEQILPSVAVGAYGVVSVASHLAGLEIKQMLDAHFSGKPEEATRLHLKLLSLCKKLFITANPIPVKAALNLTGFEAGPTRLPLAAPSEAVLDALKIELKAQGLL